jgi:hypothetical protein
MHEAARVHRGSWRRGGVAINLKTAKALGVTVPPQLGGLADV